MPASAEEVFEWHCRSGALERLLPPWEPLEVLERDGGVTDGGRVVLAVRAFGWWHRWVAEHYDYQPGRQFCDRQTEGPFRHWRHCHRVFPEGPNQSYLEEELEYTLPLGRVGQLLGGPLVRRKLERMFRYRHAITASDLALHREYAEGRRMRIAVTGSSGLVGSALVPFLTTGGHQVTRIVRSAEAGGAVFWDPVRGELDAEGLEGHDAVIHLAGENIAARRWSPEQKDRIRDSRVKGTRLLCETLARLRRPPRVVVSASAIGYYGDRGDDVLDEGSPRGTGFLPEVCHAWEAATEAAANAGIRVVHLRLGIVLSPRGGALAKMLTPFRLGVGGRIGTGRQWMSWIALDDVIGSVYHALATDSLSGPVNAVAPHPVTNQEFAKTLGRLLLRPTIFPLPAFMARLAFGEMADELLLASTRVVPVALQTSGYRFLYGELEGALRHLLGKVEPSSNDAEPRLAHMEHGHRVEAGR
ncbi:MAG: TIGR01777 family oxidoreductase [Gemmataceae bacterium]|nr:TIGR01777 family oxidoreductase [Gemmataceae bacterium]MDW8266631.1 TIGR01777 family oxidoreductase [Gemmataceae bacterium]